MSAAEEKKETSTGESRLADWRCYRIASAVALMSWMGFWSVCRARSMTFAFFLHLTLHRSEDAHIGTIDGPLHCGHGRGAG
jgi:hypothetical protein